MKFLKAVRLDASDGLVYSEGGAGVKKHYSVSKRLVIGGHKL
jgi:hypothetical protein